jgi:hypothetical protein
VSCVALRLILLSAAPKSWCALLVAADAVVALALALAAAELEAAEELGAADAVAPEEAELQAAAEALESKEKAHALDARNNSSLSNRSEWMERPQPISITHRRYTYHPIRLLRIPFCAGIYEAQRSHMSCVLGPLQKFKQTGFLLMRSERVHTTQAADMKRGHTHRLQRRSKTWFC